MRHTLALVLLSSAALAAPAAAQDLVSVCDTTRNQSPIDIVHPVRSALPGLDARYLPVPGRLFNNGGHSLQVELEGNDSLMVGTAGYRLVQLHTHWPSEHRLRGEQFAAEVHYVHVDATGQPALVLGTLVREGARNPAWDQLLALLPDGGVPGLVPIARVDVRALIGLGSLDAEMVFRYPGSLTSHPSCAGISWLVRARHTEMSRDQLNLLRKKTRTYSRPPQPLDGRVVRYRRP